MHNNTMRVTPMRAWRHQKEEKNMARATALLRQLQPLCVASHRHIVPLAVYTPRACARKREKGQGSEGWVRAGMGKIHRSSHLPLIRAITIIVMMMK